MTNMTSSNWCCSMILALCATMVLISAHADESGETPVVSPERLAYTVNPGDVLSITVWKEEDLQRQVIIRPDGAFSFPLAGDIQAEGKSIEQIRQTVAEQLEKYIPSRS